MKGGGGRKGGGLTETCMEARRCEARRDIIRISSIFAIRIKHRRERRPQRKPESTKAAKDHKTECITEEKFQYPAQTHQEAANEIIRPHRRDAITARSSPAHQFA